MELGRLYQQRPAPESGDFFKAEWLKPYEKIPPLDTLRVFAASDYAVTSKGGDYTVHVIVGVDPADKLYLLDLWRAQTTPDLWVDRMLDMAKLWKPICMGGRNRTDQGDVGPFLDRRMAERKIPIFRKQFPTKGDKSVRAQSIRGKLAMDGLYVPTKASWYAAFQQELLTFPSSKHDDMVDALGPDWPAAHDDAAAAEGGEEKKARAPAIRPGRRQLHTCSPTAASSRGGWPVTT